MHGSQTGKSRKDQITFKILNIQSYQNFHESSVQLGWIRHRKTYRHAGVSQLEMFMRLCHTISVSHILPQSPTQHPMAEEARDQCKSDVLTFY